MEILAFGVQADEKPLIEKAFAAHHDVRCLDVFLTEDTAPIAMRLRDHLHQRQRRSRQPRPR